MSTGLGYNGLTSYVLYTLIYQPESHLVTVVTTDIGAA